MKLKPTGFVARCQCGETVGALDAQRTERKEMSQILGRWLADGCTVEPRFSGSWSAIISSCQCGGLEQRSTIEDKERELTRALGYQP